MAEVKKTYYKSDKLKSECFEINGKRNGEFKSYFHNGQLYHIVMYIDDKKVE